MRPVGCVHHATRIETPALTRAVDWPTGVASRGVAAWRGGWPRPSTGNIVGRPASGQFIIDVPPESGLTVLAPEPGHRDGHRPVQGVQGGR